MPANSRWDLIRDLKGLMEEDWNDRRNWRKKII